MLRVFKCHSPGGRNEPQNLLTITQLNSHLWSTCPITAVLETSPSPVEATWAPQAPPVALPTPVTWSTALASALPTPASWAPLSTVAARTPGVSPPAVRHPVWYPVTAQGPLATL